MLLVIELIKRLLVSHLKLKRKLPFLPLGVSYLNLKLNPVLNAKLSSIAVY